MSQLKNCLFYKLVNYSLINFFKMMKRKLLILLAFFIAINTAAFSKTKVVEITVDEGIGPATTAFIKSSIEYTKEQDAEILIIKLNTPGGLLSSTRDIVNHLLESPVPTVVFVAPGGARAGSAGVFITLAANIAAMAPGTNIGAAHPVGIGGQGGGDSVMTGKVTNDAAAFIRTIAQKRNRNQEWAEQAVRESVSATENEALEKGVIDVIAKKVDSLLVKIDGMTVETDEGEVTLKTADVTLEMREKNWREKLLGVLSDPNIAYIFMMLAIYGILFELYNPGTIFPGVIGVLSGVIAAYSLQMLPINYAGLALILAAIILFIIEIYVASYGMLTIGGVISLFLGSVMLIDSPFKFVSISMEIIITVVVLTALFFIFIIGLGLKAQTRKRASGKEGIIGETGKSLSDFSPGESGRVRVHGEIWKAEAETEIIEGQQIEVVNADSFVLKVRAKSEESG